MSSHATSERPASSSDEDSIPVLLRMPAVRLRSPQAGKPASESEEIGRKTASRSEDPVTRTAAPASKDSAPPQETAKAAENAANDTAIAPHLERRRRLQERRRIQEEKEPTKRSWWTTHFPVILIGFCVALFLVVNSARKSGSVNDAENRDWNASTPPELTVEHQANPGAAAEVVQTPPAVPPDPIETAPPLPVATELKSPPLIATQTAPSERGTPDPANAPMPVSEATPSADEQPSYPTTDPGTYRSGGRLIRTARSNELAPSNPPVDDNSWR